MITGLVDVARAVGNSTALRTGMHIGYPGDITEQQRQARCLRPCQY